MDVIAAQKLDRTMSTYLGQIRGLHDFNELSLPTAIPTNELDNCSTFFMSLALYGLLIVILGLGPNFRTSFCTHYDYCLLLFASHSC